MCIISIYTVRYRNLLDTMVRLAALSCWRTRAKHFRGSTLPSSARQSTFSGALRSAASHAHNIHLVPQQPFPCQCSHTCTCCTRTNTQAWSRTRGRNPSAHPAECARAMRNTPLSKYLGLPFCRLFSQATQHTCYHTTPITQRDTSHTAPRTPKPHEQHTHIYNTQQHDALHGQPTPTKQQAFATCPATKARQQRANSPGQRTHGLLQTHLDSLAGRVRSRCGCC